MDPSVISQILKALRIRPDSVACIYNYGSWVYGTNERTSDRDLMIVTRSPKKPPLTFHADFDYFHRFELHKLWDRYNVCVYSVENFQQLLEKNYLLAIECIFLSAEFKIKEEIDFRSLYLERFYDQKRLKTVAFYENYAALHEADVAEQLIQTRSIHDYRRVSDVYRQAQQIRGDPPFKFKYMFAILEFIRNKSDALKSRLDELLPTKTVKGVFQAYVTFECSHDTEKVIEKLKETCENSKFKVIFIEFNTTTKGEKGQQLMTSSHHCGEYPAIVDQITEEINEKFRDFNTLRIQITSLASNEGVPKTKTEQMLFWDAETNHFEFHYKILVKNASSKETMMNLQRVCQPSRGTGLGLSQNALKKLDDDESEYMLTLGSVDGGRAEAVAMNERIIEHLTRESHPPLEVEQEFVVHDSHTERNFIW